MRAELSQLLIRGKKAGCSCGWGKNRSDAYAQLLCEYGQLEILEVSVADFAKKMENFSVNDMEERWHSESYPGYWHKAPTYDESLHGVLEGRKKKFGVCLDCVRDGNNTTPCRFQHE